jgi:predicted membrane-bound spermidine synthase
LTDGDVWMLTVLIFFWMVVVSAVVGGLAYAVMLRPAIGLYVVAPLAGMFLLSLGIALRMSSRSEDSSDPVIRTP